MLHHEPGLDAEHCALLDGEGFVLEVVDSARCGEVDGDVRATFDFEGEGFDDAFARVVGV